jgi:hypothetical protein
VSLSGSPGRYDCALIARIPWCANTDISRKSFLDEICEEPLEEEEDSETPVANEKSESATPTPADYSWTQSAQAGPSGPAQKTTVKDVAVEVVLSSQSLVGNTTRQKPANVREIYAHMIISVWNIENERYFTLTFTHQPGSETSSNTTMTSSSRSVDKSSRPAKSPGSVHSATSSNGRRSYYTGTSSSHPTPLPFSPSFPPRGPPSLSRQDITSAPSVLQKATRLRDAMLNIINVPAYGMWKDDTVGLANEQMLKLAHNPNVGEKLNQRDFLRFYKLYNEDFSRQLDVEEYPIMVLCKNQERFQNRIYAMPDPKTGAPRLFDVLGEPIIDEVTGEFLGGVVIFKDVSEYLERIKVLNARNADQFGIVANSVSGIYYEKVGLRKVNLTHS